MSLKRVQHHAEHSGKINANGTSLSVHLVSARVSISARLSIVLLVDYIFADPTIAVACQTCMPHAIGWVLHQVQPDMTINSY